MLKKYWKRIAIAGVVLLVLIIASIGGIYSYESVMAQQEQEQEQEQTQLLEVSVGEFTHRTTPPKVVTFDLFTTSAEGLMAVPVIETQEGKGPYLGRGQPLINTYPEDPTFKDFTWKHVKIIDNNGNPISGLPGIYRKVDGKNKYQTHVWALVKG